MLAGYLRSDFVESYYCEIHLQKYIDQIYRSIRTIRTVDISFGKFYRTLERKLMFKINFYKTN